MAIAGVSMDEPEGDGQASPAKRSRIGAGALRGLRALPVHPILFAAFPVLFLWAHNQGQGVTFWDVDRALILLIAAAAVVWLVSALILRSVGRSALIASVLVVLFFSYGYLYDAAEGWRVGGVHVGSNAVLLTLWIGLAVGAIVPAVRGGRWVPGWTRGLNLVAVTLVLLNVVPIIRYQFSANPSGAQFLEAGDVRLPRPILEKPPSHRPDVYYIILEEYGGEQALKDYFGYDNSPFLNFLSGKGFYVSHDSVTNYPRTELSVASSLNMKYINYLAQKYGTDTRDITPLIKLMQDNQIGRVMKSLGYRYIQLGSWWSPTATSPIADVNVRFGGMSEFAQLLYETTALSPEADEDSRRQKWKDALFQFSALTRLERFKGPRFVFAHIICPHGPIVFDQNGRYISQSEEQSLPRTGRYVNQLLYVNKRVEEIVNSLLSRPADQQPIIIIQSDEGPYAGAPTDWTDPTVADLERKFGILNAYYFPGLEHTGLYQTITPVNTFRVMLNTYFGAHVPLLPDRAYTFENLAHVYGFTDMTKLVQRLTEHGPSPPASPSPSG
jgi:hypothetical protein